MRYLLLITLLFSLSGCQVTVSDAPQTKVIPFNLLKIGDSFEESDYEKLTIKTQTEKYIWYTQDLSTHAIVDKRLKVVLWAGWSSFQAFDFWQDLINNRKELK